MMPVECLGCGAQAVALLVDFGPQPPSNRFMRVGESDSARHPLQLGQCAECSLFQLLNPMPVAMVKSRHAWLTYNEPEGHLDAMVAHLASGLDQSARIGGLTYKDDSTLARFNRSGYTNTFRYDAFTDLGINDERAGLETIQAVMDESLARSLVTRHGTFDLLVVRHVLEHAHSPRLLLRALGTLLAPGGRLVLEMPDCRKFIKACDYSFVWEEHITYFSPLSLSIFLHRNGFETAETVVYPYPLEDSLVTIVRPAGVVAHREPSECTIKDEVRAGRHFAEMLSEVRAAYHDYFGRLRTEGQRIAVFGAGHLAAKFINLLSLSGDVECVIDDNPSKQSLSMPGSGLPIVGSARLSDVNLCMLSLSPESEQKVLGKESAFLERGGEFASIFALSPLALKIRRNNELA